MTTSLTLREMNLRVFRREPVPHLLFQPRIEPWFAWNRRAGTLPERLRDRPVSALFDELGVSMRYTHYFTGVAHPVTKSYAADARVEETKTADLRRVVYHTPHGNMIEEHQRADQTSWRITQFPIKETADLRKLIWLGARTQYQFDRALWEQGKNLIGDRGVPQFWVPKSPYQALVQQWMQFDDFIFALADDPALVVDAMRALDDSYDGLYETLTRTDDVQIINFGENIHEQLLSPAYFQEYLLPFYTKRSGQLRRAGKFTHIHVDGMFHNLLPFFKDMDCDGLEALTPKPQGDATLEEIAAHSGDKIILDVLPALLFLPNYSREQLLACVERSAKLFGSRLILGISDELPEGSGEEGIERVRLVADWCRKHHP